MLVFNALFDRLSATGTPYNVGLGSLTISLWVASADTDHHVINRDAIGGNAGWAIQGIPQKARCKICDGSSTALFDTTTVIWDGALHHLVFVINRTNNTMYAYVDNGSAENVTDISSIGSMDTSAFLVVGANYTSTTFYAGSIYEIAIWNTVLTTGEVARLYDNKQRWLPLKVAPESLLGYWPLDSNDNNVYLSSLFGDTATKCVDLSVNKNNLIPLLNVLSVPNAFAGNPLYIDQIGRQTTLPLPLSERYQGIWLNGVKAR
jgi:hypothetical protein